MTGARAGVEVANLPPHLRRVLTRVRFKVRGLCERRLFALTIPMPTNKDELFLTRLNHRPHLRERMEMLLNVVENVAGDCTKADAAEQAVIEEVRQMGNAAL
jgi:hypothetical protein